MLSFVFQNGRTALHLGATRKRTDAINLLLEHNADIDAQDTEGTTALMMAAKGEHISNACVLVRSGADFDLLDSHGRDALSYLSNEQHKEQLQGEMDLRCTNYPVK